MLGRHLRRRPISAPTLGHRHVFSVRYATHLTSVVISGRLTFYHMFLHSLLSEYLLMRTGQLYHYIHLGQSKQNSCFSSSIALQALSNDFK